MKDSKYPTKEIYFDAMVNTAAPFYNLIITDSQSVPYIVKLVLTTILSLFLRGI